MCNRAALATARGIGVVVRSLVCESSSTAFQKVQELQLLPESSILGLRTWSLGWLLISVPYSMGLRVEVAQGHPVTA